MERRDFPSAIRRNWTMITVFKRSIFFGMFICLNCWSLEGQRFIKHLFNNSVLSNYFPSIVFRLLFSIDIREAVCIFKLMSLYGNIDHFYSFTCHNSVITDAKGVSPIAVNFFQRLDRLAQSLLRSVWASSPIPARQSFSPSFIQHTEADHQFNVNIWIESIFPMEIDKQNVMRHFTVVVDAQTEPQQPSLTHNSHLLPATCFYAVRGKRYHTAHHVWTSDPWSLYNIAFFRVSCHRCHQCAYWQFAFANRLDRVNKNKLTECSSQTIHCEICSINQSLLSSTKKHQCVCHSMSSTHFTSNNRTVKFLTKSTQNVFVSAMFIYNFKHSIQ